MQKPPQAVPSLFLVPGTSTHKESYKAKEGGGYLSHLGDVLQQGSDGLGIVSLQHLHDAACLGDGPQHEAHALLSHLQMCQEFDPWAFNWGPGRFPLGEAKQGNCKPARNKKHTGDAPSDQPIVAGVSPQRKGGGAPIIVGTLK